MVKLFTLITQMCCVIAAMLTWLANEWLTVGYGLNPWIAITAATIFMIIPHVIDRFFVEDVPDDDPHGLSTIRIRGYVIDKDSIEKCVNHPVRDLDQEEGINQFSDFPTRGRGY